LPPSGGELEGGRGGGRSCPRAPGHVKADVKQNTEGKAAPKGRLPQSINVDIRTELEKRVLYAL
jgi:hypothetical protein